MTSSQSALAVAGSILGVGVILGGMVALVVHVASQDPALRAGPDTRGMSPSRVRQVNRQHTRQLRAQMRRTT